MKPRHMKGFTLVELLVVVGIIAILISLLLPSLGRARASAQSVACLSNLRQIIMATRMYAEANQNYIPSGRYSASLSRNTWYTNVAPYMGTGKTPVNVLDPTTGPTSEAVLTLNSVWTKLDCPAQDISVSPGGVVQGVPHRTYGIYMTTGSWHPLTARGYPYTAGYGLQDYITGQTRKITQVRNVTTSLAYADTYDVDYVYAAMWGIFYYNNSPAYANRYLPARHSNRYNVAFVDGHAESIPAEEFRDPENQIWRTTQQ